ncbi:hypothetical protein BpHYR1_021317 [Brachionus plicatilis]|uniref:Uncharacterized protein n=1 Tax=Brachionus plicatilis TaxID=10195 RepID=A0A3M7SVA7_BRAPC|nr:hypothetical protein BpHYR1_021317 [Brachionus plicatilis]
MLLRRKKLTFEYLKAINLDNSLNGADNISIAKTNIYNEKENDVNQQASAHVIKTDQHSIYFNKKKSFVLKVSYLWPHRQKNI